MDLPKEEKSLESKESQNNKSFLNNQPPDDDSLSSHDSIFDGSLSNKKEEEKVDEENHNENKNNNNDNNNILNMFLNKKKKRELTQEQKEERIKRNIERYCARNDKMLELLDKINNNEITRKNIDDMMRLLAIDLSDTKKLANKKALISQKKNEMFNKLFDLTFKEYQYFWFTLTQGKYNKGNAQLINSSNMRNAKLIYDGIIEKRKTDNKVNKDKKKEKTVREIIAIRNNMDIEDEKLDEVFLMYDPDISSDDDSLDSSVDDSLSESDEKSQKEKKEEKKEERKEKKDNEKEKELKEINEEMKEKNEKMKKLMDEEDEIDIFN